MHAGSLMPSNPTLSRQHPLELRPRSFVVLAPLCPAGVNAARRCDLLRFLFLLRPTSFKRPRLGRAQLRPANRRQSGSFANYGITVRHPVISPAGNPWEEERKRPGRERRGCNKGVLSLPLLEERGESMTRKQKRVQMTYRGTHFIHYETCNIR